MNNRFVGSLRARAVVMLGVVSAAALVMAARPQTSVRGMQRPAGQPPAKAGKIVPKVAVDSPMTIGAAMEAVALKVAVDSPMTIGAAMEAVTLKSAEDKADSLQLAGASALGNSMHQAAMAMSALAPTRPKVAAAWPVDARTGQTLINGVPVVGRVFVQRKVDGLVAYRYADVYVGEPSHPLPPVVKPTYRKPPLAATRRVRGIMVEATLWSMDRKRAARMNQRWR